MKRVECLNFETYGLGVADKISDLAARIRQLAADNNTTHQQLADVLGVSRNTVHRRLTQQSKFTVNELLILSHHWDMDIGELLHEAA